MIGLAMEIPTDFLDSWTPLTDFDFVLAHRVLEDVAYRRFYAKRPSGRECILDNSMHELGHPLPVASLLEAAVAIRADFVIPPDRLGEAAWNLEQFRRCAWEFRDTPIGVASVLCGATPALRETYMWHTRSAPMICLPFREPRLQWFFDSPRNIHLFERVHLLGVNELDELRRFATLSARSTRTRWTVDTAKPIKWGLEGALLESLTSLRNAPTGSKELLDLRQRHVTPFQEHTIRLNVAALRSVCAGAAE
jgi:hypothetical protein